VAAVVETALEPHVEIGTCPHLAVLLRSQERLASVLAAFYALGAKRGGWLVHRVLQGDSEHERERLAGAGLDVAALEAAGHLLLAEFDAAEPPEDSTRRWERGLKAALSDGYTGLWYSRFPVGRDQEQYARVLLYERAWDACFRDRPVVTLCPYIVGELTAGDALERLTRVAELHSGVLVEAGEGALPQLKLA
jgi:MEDS: MEthanogen/methylotroph, DcmR Sensory domain